MNNKETKVLAYGHTQYWGYSVMQFPCIVLAFRYFDKEVASDFCTVKIAGHYEALDQKIAPQRMITTW